MTSHAAPFRSVIFDCDSTLSAIEGIDELASAHRDEIEALTNAAMRGEVRLEDVYAKRLAIVKPTRAQVDALARRYIDAAVAGARETIGGLHRAGVQVRVLSGGLRPAVAAFARTFGIDGASVHAVDIYFAGDGSYAGFDERSPLARTGGKAIEIASWGDALPRPAMLVGDGTTDLEAKPFVDCFVAFAGVVARESVIASADVAIFEPSLHSILALALHHPSHTS